MNHFRKRQRGTTLIVSMIFLVVLSIIGLAGMDVTGLEERMAGNLRDRNISFQAAEAALREGESFIATTAPLPSFNGTNGLYPKPNNGVKRWETIDWSASSAVRNYAGPGFAELASQPAYIIEDLDLSVKGLNPGDPVVDLGLYRITARSEGLSGSADIILQTIYKR